MDYDVRDIKLADQGKLKIEWAEVTMPVLRLIRKRFKRQQPLKGVRVTACLHVTAPDLNGLGNVVRQECRHKVGLKMLGRFFADLKAAVASKVRREDFVDLVTTMSVGC